MSPRERPILMSAPMVRATLDGTKTQTRRIVGLDTLRPSSTPGYDWTWRGRAPVRSIAQQQRHPSGCWQDVTAARLLALCPYGAPGDRLWVRETWGAWRQTSVEYDEWEPVTNPFDGSWSREVEERGRPFIEYRATSDSVGPWLPSIHMPRWASRILLEITEVRVERLQAITQEEARAEGVPGDDYITPRSEFIELWDSINAKRVPWSADPWVWVVGFRRVLP